MIDVTLQSLASTYKLNDGHEIPVVGFGTWQMDNDENTTNIVKQAIKEGIRILILLLFMEMKKQ